MLFVSGILYENTSARERERVCVCVSLLLLIKKYASTILSHWDEGIIFFNINQQIMSLMKQFLPFD